MAPVGWEAGHSSAGSSAAEFPMRLQVRCHLGLLSNLKVWLRKNLLPSLCHCWRHLVPYKLMVEHLGCLSAISGRLTRVSDHMSNFLQQSPQRCLLPRSGNLCNLIIEIYWDHIIESTLLYSIDLKQCTQGKGIMEGSEYQDVGIIGTTILKIFSLNQSGWNPL